MFTVHNERDSASLTSCSDSEASIEHANGSEANLAKASSHKPKSPEALERQVECRVNEKNLANGQLYSNNFDQRQTHNQYQYEPPKQQRQVNVATAYLASEDCDGRQEALKESISPTSSPESPSSSTSSRLSSATSPLSATFLLATASTSSKQQQQQQQQQQQPQQQQQQQQQQQHKTQRHHQQAQTQRQQDFEDVKQVVLFGESIVALTINGKERLCLAQISNTLLKGFSYNEIHNRRVALGITCVQCTPIQLEMLRRAGAMPSSSRRCGMITRREAERLCRSFLVEEQPPELPENFYFTVAHRINYGCKGRFIPARYISSRAKCIECFYCGDLYSPNKFIFHSHRQPHATECNPPDSPNINSWRKHIDLDWTLEHGQDIRYAWEDVKSLFNGGTRRRTAAAAAAAAAAASAAAAAAVSGVQDQNNTSSTRNSISRSGVTRGSSAAPISLVDSARLARDSSVANSPAGLKSGVAQRKITTKTQQQQMAASISANLLPTMDEDNTEQLIDVEQFFDECIGTSSMSAPIHQNEAHHEWQRSANLAIGKPDGGADKFNNPLAGPMPADLSTAYYQKFAGPTKRAANNLTSINPVASKKCDYSALPRAIAAPQQTPMSSGEMTTTNTNTGSNTVHLAKIPQPQQGLTGLMQPSRTLESRSFGLNPAQYYATSRKLHLPGYRNIQASNDPVATQASVPTGSPPPNILVHPKQEPVACVPIGGLQIPGRLLEAKPKLEPLVGPYSAPMTAAAVATSNLLYSQLHSQSIQSQQQLQPQQFGPVTIDAQLALRHHLWSSLLANLQCNPVPNTTTTFK